MAPHARHVVAALACVGAVAAAPDALGGPARRVALEWSQGEPACVSATELVSMVERTLGRPVFHAEAPSSGTVAGGVTRAGAGRFEAHVVLRGADGRVLAERALTTEGNCARLDESVALVVTLMIDSLEETPTTLAIPAREARPAASASPPKPPLLLTLGLGPGLSWSLLPGFAPSVDLRGEIAPRGFIPLALTVRVLPFASVVVGGVGGRFSAWTAELAVCPGWSSERVRLGACAGIAGGTLEGSQVNLLDGESHVRPLVLATLVPFVTVRLGGPVWARLEAGAWFPFLRDPWGYLNARGAFTQVFRSAPVVPASTLTFDLQSGS